MSALNEVILSQPYQTHDDHSFVFLMKVGRSSSAVEEETEGMGSGGLTIILQWRT